MAVAAVVVAVVVVAVVVVEWDKSTKHGKRVLLAPLRKVSARDENGNIVIKPALFSKRCLSSQLVAFYRASATNTIHSVREI